MHFRTVVKCSLAVATAAAFGSAAQAATLNASGSLENFDSIVTGTTLPDGWAERQG